MARQQQLDCSSQLYRVKQFALIAFGVLREHKHHDAAEHDEAGEHDDHGDAQVFSEQGFLQGESFLSPAYSFTSNL